MEGEDLREPREKIIRDKMEKRGLLTAGLAGGSEGYCTHFTRSKGRF